MLIPITRKKFEELVPLIATANQYRYCWGKIPDMLRRIWISIAAVLVVVIVWLLSAQSFKTAFFIVGFSAALYWLWAPIYWASIRNFACRKYRFCGFWEGEIVDIFVSEDLVGKEETVNKRGDLVIVENRERWINLEVEDETGFAAQVRAPLKRDHRAIRRGDLAQMIVFSDRPDLSSIIQQSDVYLPDSQLWVSDYPVLRRDIFIEVSRRLK